MRLGWDPTLPPPPINKFLKLQAGL